MILFDKLKNKLKKAIMMYNNQTVEKILKSSKKSGS